ncbi:MAG: hypothetical protein PHI98_08510 [Eubacteriales bacterium]|nr:hypothetical protein [Eubacteriales bacterium]
MHHPPCDCHECADREKRRCETECWDPCGPVTAPYCPPPRPKPEPCPCKIPEPCCQPEQPCPCPKHDPCDRPRPQPCHQPERPCPCPKPDPCDRPRPQPCHQPEHPCPCSKPEPCDPPRPRPCPPPKPPKPRPCLPPKTMPCDHHCPPPKPRPEEGCRCKPVRPRMESVLLQKIIACERRVIPNLCTALKLEGLPCCAEPPFTLLMVQQSGAQPWWTPLESHGPDTRLHLRVCIPVCCQVRDCRGKLYEATSMVEAEISLKPACPISECWKNSIFVVPCVRLLCAECCSEDETFEVRLEVKLEVYLLRPEPCMMHKPEPPCPDLPLYPQPVRPLPPCWQQCPADQAPYGWPRQG